MNKFKKAIKEIRELREADEKEYKEKEMILWFDNLLLIDQAIIGITLFRGLNLEDKIRLYEAMQP
ncbi:unnamed protein product [marine sediment metagenome]|uniref:Uncharacterized protein n=1 Tax=marine sediment metagenome TaxID=412755 RepID=X1BN78_9ZZZZ